MRTYVLPTKTRTDRRARKQKNRIHNLIPSKIRPTDLSPPTLRRKLPVSMCRTTVLTSVSGPPKLIFEIDVQGSVNPSGGPASALPPPRAPSVFRLRAIVLACTRCALRAAASSFCRGKIRQVAPPAAAHLGWEGGRGGVQHVHPENTVERLLLVCIENSPDLS